MSLTSLRRSRQFDVGATFIRRRVETNSSKSEVTHLHPDGYGALFETKARQLALDMHLEWNYSASGREVARW
jgi:hypothetical protein